MSFITLPAKLSTTTVPVQCDFSGQLISGEALTAATVTASVFVGVDATPSNIISGSASVSQNTVTQTITGGTVGVIYLLSFNGTTNLSNLIIINAYLAVTDTNPFQA